MKRGFTLIELMIVICIIVILGVIILPIVRKKTVAAPPATPVMIRTGNGDVTNQQLIIKLPIVEFDAWVKKNPENEIVTLTSICENGYNNNPTTHILVVYRSPAEK